jgi:hypothetical protein
MSFCLVCLRLRCEPRLHYEASVETPPSAHHQEMSDVYRVLRCTSNPSRPATTTQLRAPLAAQTHNGNVAAAAAGKQSTPYSTAAPATRHQASKLSVAPYAVASSVATTAAAPSPARSLTAGSGRHSAYRRSDSVVFGDASTVGVQERPRYDLTQRLRVTPRASAAVNIYTGYPAARPNEDAVSVTRSNSAAATRRPPPTPRYADPMAAAGAGTASRFDVPQHRPAESLQLAYDSTELRRLLCERSEGIRRSQRFGGRPDSARGHLHGAALSTGDDGRIDAVRTPSDALRRQVRGNGSVILPDPGFESARTGESTTAAALRASSARRPLGTATEPPAAGARPAPSVAPWQHHQQPAPSTTRCRRSLDAARVDAHGAGHQEPHAAWLHRAHLESSTSCGEGLRAQARHIRSSSPSR